MTAIALEGKAYRRIVNAWCMYDWANSAFATTVMAALLPPYFSGVAAAGLPRAQATSYWGYGVSLSMVLVALMGPILGAIADYTGGKKRYLGSFLALALVFTGLLFFVGEGDWGAALAFYVLASIGNGGANVFYDSLLPHVARPDEIDQVSTRGFALGYLGGGLLLAINLAWYVTGALWLCRRRPGGAHRVLSVAVWAVFSIPCFGMCPAPRGAGPRVGRYAPALAAWGDVSRPAALQGADQVPGGLLALRGWHRRDHQDGHHLWRRIGWHPSGGRAVAHPDRRHPADHVFGRLARRVGTSAPSMWR